MKNKWVMFMICLFFGYFGIHKFIEKDYKMGILYLCTLGLFGIGWIYDLYKYATIGSSSGNLSSALPREAKEKIYNNQLPRIEVKNLILKNGEYCCYIDKAYTYEDKTRVEGYSGRNSGFSIRIMKGLTYRTGGGKGKAIRSTYREINNGYLYVTNKRIVFTAPKLSFDIEFDKISSIMEAKDGVIIQKGSKSYCIIVKSHKELMKVINLARNEKIEV